MRKPPQMTFSRAAHSLPCDKDWFNSGAMSLQKFFRDINRPAAVIADNLTTP